MGENSWFWTVVAGSLILGICIIVAAVFIVFCKRRQDALAARKLAAEQAAKEQAEQPE